MNEISLLVIKFRIGGNLRFLSHAQTLRVFQRACVRAGLKIQYSQGFNPRPKLSLPLPRPVGVASDDELLCIRCSMLNGQSDLCDLVKAALSKQLPEGCELLSVNVAQPGTSFQPCSATYVLAVRKEYLNEQLKTTIERLLASESISVQRQIDKRKSRIKNIDVRGFLESIELDRDSIIVKCKISSAGSIRVDEILKLLELDVEKLASPIRRTSVQWKSN
ncbi:MAG: DUF2344 domain-containing protein [Planctomycetes bacterium]|nr:DUF2344 domain-containing protein [Planctomycetota bacterium]